MKKTIILLLALSPLSAYALSLPTALPDGAEKPVAPVYSPLPESVPQQDQNQMQTNQRQSVPRPAAIQKAQNIAQKTTLVRTQNPDLKALADGNFYPESHFVLSGYSIVSKIDNTVAQNFDINHDGNTDMSLTLLRNEYVTTYSATDNALVPNFKINAKSIPANSMVSILLIGNGQGLYAVKMVSER